MDIIQVLIIIGVIVFAIVKQLRSATEEAKKRQQQEMNMPDENGEMEDMEFENTYPEPFLSYDYDHPVSSAQSTVKVSSKKPSGKIESQISPPILEEPEDEQEFNIHSAEEVRRGIIWSEILKRKY